MSNAESQDKIIAQVLASYATRPEVTPDDIIDLLSKLQKKLGSQGTEVSAKSPKKQEPALPLSQAVSQNQVFCLCCGKGFKMLKRHLGAEHGLTESEYRKLFDLPETIPLVAPSYSDRKAAHAKQAGLGKYHRDAPKNDKVYAE
ncbi:MAG: MucR family transcriptional regulator [Rhodobacteraceae bacterium]|nr:MucR family transcriptional regulator [Paracoccaceae bacterium]